MKKSILFSAALASMAAFSSCSNTDEPVVVVGEGDVQEIVLQVANTNGGLTTRAGRDLLSSEAAQKIDAVKVYICKKGTGEIVKDIPAITDWTKDGGKYSIKEYTDNGHGREAIIKLTEDDCLGEGEYTIYAVGYSNDSNYGDVAAALVKDGKFNVNAQLSCSGVAEEIFAGSHDIKVEKGFKTSVVLNRQVAGSYGYFERIPYETGAVKLVLEASNANSTLVLGQFANAVYLNNGNNDSDSYVINGTTESENKVVYEITLSDWFDKIEDANEDGVIDDTTWKNYLTGKATVQKGSVLGGNFIIPFAKTTGNTLTLKLVDKDGESLRKWAVKLPAEDRQLKEYTLFSFADSTFGDGVTDKDSQSVYNILRNHLYTLGAKGKDKEPDPDKPTTPDDPQPLDHSHELTLRVNDNWEVIHKMVIEEF